MSDLKLPKLPDRTPVKLALALPPDLANALAEYQAIYNERYRVSETQPELAVQMIAAFLASDREFARERRARKRAEQR